MQATAADLRAQLERVWADKRQTVSKLESSQRDEVAQLQATVVALRTQLDQRPTGERAH